MIGKAWMFFAGVVFATFILVVTSPLLIVGLGALAWSRHGESYSALSGESVFGLRDSGGGLDGRMVNVGFHTVMVPVAGDPRPRRLLLRLEVVDSDVFATGPAEGRVRLDAWPLDGPEQIRSAALYTVIAPGRAASIEGDGTLVVERGTRRSVYALSSGEWLYDADVPATSFTLEGERRRVVAISGAEDDMPPGSIAVLTYATNQTALKRVMLTADDATRARLLRSSVAMTRPVPRMEDASRRTIDLNLAAGTVRIPIDGDSLDLARAQLPAGLGLVEMNPWVAAR
ncbi:hypothetical protein [Magnetospirillum sp. UT-4]|uniref:hypothetical protein n=1 Tax=Magnetospirillum sp. UT-4 TaxID=2681467 RepID=UPI001382DED0|nr:hypothetical protein [Magnetospirillum sp. UT-4]CAA7626972.1 conserved hypothetical protein [Magnetospirillum sp. UT-4]